PANHGRGAPIDLSVRSTQDVRHALTGSQLRDGRLQACRQVFGRFVTPGDDGRTKRHMHRRAVRKAGTARENIARAIEVHRHYWYARRNGQTRDAKLEASERAIS